MFWEKATRSKEYFMSNSNQRGWNLFEKFKENEWSNNSKFKSCRLLHVGRALRGIIQGKEKRIESYRQVPYHNKRNSLNLKSSSLDFSSSKYSMSSSPTILNNISNYKNGNTINFSNKKIFKSDYPDQSFRIKKAEKVP